MYSKADDRPIERSHHVERVLKKTANKISGLEARTGWRILIQWGEPLWETASPDLADYDIILAIAETDQRFENTWTLRLATSVDEETLGALRVQSLLLSKDLVQTSPEFALERLMEALERALPAKAGHLDLDDSTGL